MITARHLHEALDVLWPRSCVGCGAPAQTLCDDCTASWQPTAFEIDDMSVTALGDYSGGLKRAVLACKEQGNAGAARRLGSMLAAGCPAADALAIVPPGASGLRRRGFHAVEWLAKAVASAHRMPLLRMRFAAVSADGPQKQRTRDERLAVQRPLRFKRALWRPAQLDGLRIAAVDDVVTTGATMLSAGRAIEDAGATFVGGIAIARTLRHADRSGY